MLTRDKPAGVVISVKRFRSFIVMEKTLTMHCLVCSGVHFDRF